AESGGGAGGVQGDPKAPADRRRRTSRATEEARIPRRQSETHTQGPPGRRKRSPRASRFRRQGRPALRRDDGTGDRDEGGPRDRTRRGPRARLRALVLGERGDGFYC